MPGKVGKLTVPQAHRTIDTKRLDSDDGWGHQVRVFDETDLEPCILVNIEVTDDGGVSIVAPAEMPESYRDYLRDEYGGGE